MTDRAKHVIAAIIAAACWVTVSTMTYHDECGVDYECER